MSTSSQKTRIGGSRLAEPPLFRFVLFSLVLFGLVGFSMIANLGPPPRAQKRCRPSEAPLSQCALHLPGLNRNVLISPTLPTSAENHVVTLLGENHFRSTNHNQTKNRKTSDWISLLNLLLPSAPPVTLSRFNSYRHLIEHPAVFSLRYCLYPSTPLINHSSVKAKHYARGWSSPPLTE